MQAIAKKRGGKCLSKKYVNGRTKLKWECVDGHRWEAAPEFVKHGTWCPTCGIVGLRKNPTIAIEELHKLAKSRGGKCLSKKYVNNRTPLEWECKEGHRWEATPGSVNSGAWCHECGGSKKLTIEEMQVLAKSRGGKCLSKKYVNARTKLQWECEKGHRWKSTPSKIKNRGQWCPECGRKKRGMKRRLGIEVMHEIAERQGGKCLSKKYVNSRSYLEWECSEGHRWRSKPNNIRSGKWCAECAGIKKLTIEEAQAIAKSRGGKCLSKKYTSAHTKLKWECANGHRWLANITSVKHSNTWCSECSAGISERICRAYFQQIFGKRFPKSRPKWLKNSSGYQLELDGYCKDLKIAFEYQGEQHNTAVKFYGGLESLLQIRKNDKEKMQLCNKHGIRLFAIPSFISRLDLQDLNQFIYDKCLQLRIRRPRGMRDKKINLKNAWVSDGRKQILKELHKVARERGGECVSNEYLYSDRKLEWKCDKGHRWKSIPYSVKDMGYWCPECALENKRLSIDIAHQLAKKNGGKCLSKSYKNVKEKLKWECAEGHRWLGRLDHIKGGGGWCQKCFFARRRSGSFKKVQLIAKKQGGKCLSKEKDYSSRDAKLRFQCKDGHKWFGNVSKIICGIWCPKCAGFYKTIEDMHSLAKKHGGKCLSKKYINSYTKLKWECAVGHRWSALPTKTWCPKCAHKSRTDTIENMQAIAKKRGGKCISKKYEYVKKHLEWECAEGHRWKAVPSTVKNGSWCSICAFKKFAIGIEKMQLYAKKHSGVCLSKEYKDNNTYLEWKCSEGHRWKARPRQLIYEDKWCPECNKIKIANLALDEMRSIAKSRGGKCLSKKYVDNKTHLEWECAKGHRWKAVPNHIKHNQTWCRKCGIDAQRGSIEEMQEIAESRGGKCLSKKYKDIDTYLNWECSEGHRWKAKPSNVKINETWCPKCWENRRGQRSKSVK